MNDHKSESNELPWLRESELFTSGHGGYHTYRIPALAVTSDGTILSF